MAFVTAKVVITYLNESVVEKEHDGSKVPGPFLAPEQHLTDITYILDFWVSHTELPVNDQRLSFCK